MQQMQLLVVKKKDKLQFKVGPVIKGTKIRLATFDISSGDLEIILEAANQLANIYIKKNNEKILVAECIDLSPYTTEEAGGFVGCTIGLYASSNSKESDNYCDFSYFNVEEV